MALAPALALAVFAVALGSGARSDATAAQVFGGFPRADGARVWRISTIVEESGVRESVSRPVRVSVGPDGPGPTVTWSGRTNADGVAEASFELGKAGLGARLKARVEGEDGKVLAEGIVDEGAALAGHTSEAGGPWLRPARLDGGIAIEVAMPSERLSTLEPTTLWVRARDKATGAAMIGVRIDGEGEQGIAVVRSGGLTGVEGYAPLVLQAQHHVAGLIVRAGGRTGTRGEWFGPVPVALGSPVPRVPSVIGAGAPLAVQIVAQPATPRAYVVVSDGERRIAAATLDLTDGAAAGPFVVPPLAPGLYWVGASAAPNGFESASPASFGRPLLVEPPGAAPQAARGSLVPDLAAAYPTMDEPRASKLAETFANARRPRLAMELLLDGFATKGAKDAARHQRGLALALGALLTAAALEAILVLLGARESRRELARVARELDDGATLEEKGGTVVVVLHIAAGVLLVGLGFFLLAALAGTS